MLAAPVLAIEALLERVCLAAGEGTVVTDVGSTKRKIVRAAERLSSARAPSFVGSHPLAGSEQSGDRVARADLFRGATVVVTPTERTGLTALKRVDELWEALGARVNSLDPGRTIGPWRRQPLAASHRVRPGPARRASSRPRSRSPRGDSGHDAHRAGDPDMQPRSFWRIATRCRRASGPFRRR